MFLKHNYKALLWAFLILFVCSLPGNKLPDISSWSFQGMDKVVHIVLYFVFAILLLRGFQRQYSFAFIKTHYVASALFVCILYGLLIEIFQATILIDRSAELNDLLANAAGALSGTIYFFVVMSRQ